ncbi:MAG: cysteine-rich small domain-containing protein [Clostridiales bacterium]|nr:cysteine-rich small domain-containing protein [Clostridiales bacterium]
MDNEYKAYSFFSHINCEYFPCHTGIDEKNFNCLFCYCPLYFLDGKCGGGFSYTAKGVKDCTNCTFPHERKNYDRVIDTLKREARNR